MMSVSAATGLVKLLVTIPYLLTSRSQIPTDVLEKQRSPRPVALARGLRNERMVDRARFRTSHCQRHASFDTCQMSGYNRLSGERASLRADGRGSGADCQQEACTVSV